MKKYFLFLLTLMTLLLIPSIDGNAAAVKLSKKSQTLYITGTDATATYDTHKIKIKKSKKVKIKKVTYKSSNKSVATVSKKGLIKAKGKGSCKIRIYVTYKKSNKTFKKTLTLKTTVKVRDGVLSLNKTNISVKPGETFTLTLNNGINKQITWYCSNSNVVTFEKAKKNKVWIYAKAPGTATITVKCNGETFTCDVTVLEEE